MMLNAAEIIKTVKKLIEVRVEMVKKDFEEHIAQLITKIALLSMMVILGVLILLFSSISLAFYFAEITYSNALGFFYVGLIYLGLFIVLYIIKDSKTIQHSILEGLHKFFVYTKNQKSDNNE
ncbi:phage holin family protein [Echinicola salinicaeni]|uniref:phage holin family protein n=1 Tax=Echinicola salinicaeni TaxID=2762757 RepID=UPI0016469538|nr:phage holin family protein [Echinicola salinicaeni]